MMKILKKLWREYEKSDETDPVLDQAMEALVKRTGLAEEDILDVADQFISDKFSFAAGNFQLTKSAIRFPTAAVLLTMAPGLIADLVSKVISGNNSSEKEALVKAMIDQAEDHGGNVKATPLAKSLKDRRQWAEFERFFEKHVTSVRAGKNINSYIGSALEKGDLFYYLQEYKKGKGYGLPWYSTITLLVKFISIVVRRLFKFGAVVGLLGAAGYGAYRVYDFFNSDKSSSNEAKAKSTEVTPEKPSKSNETMVDSINRQLNQLYGDK